MHFPVARNRTQVTHPEAFALLDAGNAIYGFMLRCLGACYQTQWDDAAPREGLVAAAFKSMRALSIVGSELASRAAAAGDDAGPRAGISFAMLRCTEGLSADSRLGVLRERAAELAAHAVSLPLHPAAREKLRGALDEVFAALA